MWQMTVIRCHGRSFYVSPHRRTEEGIQGLWDLAITSASTWLKHFQKYGLLESVAVNGTYTKSDKRWGMISGGDRVVGIHTLLYAHVCVRQRERWTSVPSVPIPPLQNHTSTPQKWISTLPTFPRLCLRAHCAHAYIIMYPLPAPFILPFKLMF